MIYKPSKNLQCLFKFAFIANWFCWLVAIAPMLYAQNSHWVNPSGGSYSTPTNWVPNIPGSTDTAIFAVPGTGPYDVEFSSNQTVADLFISNNVDVHFINSGNIPDRPLFQISGSANIESSNLVIHGPLDLQSNELTVENGSELRIEEGARLDNQGLVKGWGAIKVIGVDDQNEPSTWNANAVQITRGGYFYVDAGAEANHDHADIGISAIDQEQSAAVIHGTDESGNPSTWNIANSLQTGQLGNSAYLLFHDGALVNSRNAIFVGDSTVLVSGAGPFGRPTQFNIQETLRIDGVFADSDPYMTLSRGAQLNSQTTEIGGHAYLKIDGTYGDPNWTNSEDVYVGGWESGPTGPGELIVINGGNANLGGSLMVWPEGQVQIDEGHLQVDSISNTSGGTFMFQAGTLQTNEFHGNLFNQAGTLMPGGSVIGQTSVFGNYLQTSDATLAIDINLTEQGIESDFFSASGTAFIDGTLQMTLTGDLDSSSSTAYQQEFAIASATNLEGEFDNVFNGQRFQTADGRGTFVINYGTGSPYDENIVILSDFVMVGDVNRDGKINLLDVDPFIVVLGNDLYDAVADINGDLVVNLLDVQPFIDLLANP